MGANIDALAEGTNLGVSQCNTLNYDATSIGTKSLYEGVSKSMTRYRTNAQSASFFSGDESKSGDESE